MPPLGEVFRPTTQLSQEELVQREIIDQKTAELGAVMLALTPTLKRSRFGNGSSQSAKAYYEDPDLPSTQMMEAYVIRLNTHDGSSQYVQLDARPVHRKNKKAVSYHAADTRAVVDDTGETSLQINSFFARGNFDSLGFEQKLELMESVAETLVLVAEASQAQASLQSA